MMTRSAPASQLIWRSTCTTRHEHSFWARASRIWYGHIQTKLTFICGFSLNSPVGQKPPVRPSFFPTRQRQACCSATPLLPAVQNGRRHCEIRSMKEQFLPARRTWVLTRGDCSPVTCAPPRCSWQRWKKFPTLGRETYPHAVWLPYYSRNLPAIEGSIIAQVTREDFQQWNVAGCSSIFVRFRGGRRLRMKLTLFVSQASANFRDGTLFCFVCVFFSLSFTEVWQRAVLLVSRRGRLGLRVSHASATTQRAGVFSPGTRSPGRPQGPWSGRSCCGGRNSTQLSALCRQHPPVLCRPSGRCCSSADFSLHSHSRCYYEVPILFPLWAAATMKRGPLPPLSRCCPRSADTLFAKTYQKFLCCRSALYRSSTGKNRKKTGRKMQTIVSVCTLFR